MGVDAVLRGRWQGSAAVPRQLADECGRNRRLGRLRDAEHEQRAERDADPEAPSRHASIVARVADVAAPHGRASFIQRFSRMRQTTGSFVTERVRWNAPGANTFAPRWVS